ncbi:MAG: UxaA family hydrolase, partial [Magnetococcales bacterium]|nr:UxaA family hydrolase [Magnetococcales bacterium]
LTILHNFITHPNVGGVLVIDLGCEQTNRAALRRYLDRTDQLSTVATLDWLTIQQEGGVHHTITRGLDILRQRLPSVNATVRQPYPLRHLVVGTECGASDAFSGITANPLIGHAVDQIIAGGGSAILSEVPEMIGAEHLLIQRMRSPQVVAAFHSMMRWYREMAARLEVNMGDNLVPENRSGGLLNPCIKSLGAIAKGGTTVIEGILEYGERLTQPGLHLMQGPGNDLESVTGLAASGANLICFSTGKGTVTGSAIVPVIKVTSTSERFRLMPDDMDFNAGRLIQADQPCSLADCGHELLQLILATASGQRTQAEKNGQRQFQVWTAGKLSL